MKKIVTLLLFCISIVVNAQTYHFISTEVAYGPRVDNGRERIIQWSDWEKYSTHIYIDYTNDMIQIKDKINHTLKITDIKDHKYNDGEEIDYYATDLNLNIKCRIRTRIESNGQSQLYIFYSPYGIVYNVTRIADEKSYY